MIRLKTIIGGQTFEVSGKRYSSGMDRFLDVEDSVAEEIMRLDPGVVKVRREDVPASSLPDSAPSDQTEQEVPVESKRRRR